MISFDFPWFFWYPEPFPTTNFFIRNIPVIAPFWSDNDIRREGDIHYATYQQEPDGEANILLEVVSSFIRNQSELGDSSFRGRWMVVAEWNRVHPYPHGVSTSFIADQDLLNFVNQVCTSPIALCSVSKQSKLSTYTCQEPSCNYEK